MSLHPVVGHVQVRTGLARAAMRGKLPGSLLLHGPTGVGRQRMALWLAQLLLCEVDNADEPCGACSGCRFVLALQHPDLHWFFPLPRPKSAGSPEKLAEALEEARADALQARRAMPLQASFRGEPVGLYLAQIQTLRRTAAARPVMGERRIFIIGDADLLVPQEASPEAANALLKLLEEPPDDATIILTAPDPDALLPTVRSRVLPIRLAPLDETLVADFLIHAAHAQPADARFAAHLAGGTIGRALAFLPGDGEAGPLETLRLQARAWLAAATTSDPAARLRIAHRTPPAGARGAFLDALEQLAVWCRDLAASASGADTAIINTDAAEFLREASHSTPGAAAGLPEALASIAEVHALTANNINPQLAIAWLLKRIHQAIAASAAHDVSHAR